MVAFAARNPEVETLEGNQEGLVVLIEFDSMDEAAITFQMLYSCQTGP